ncbi:MAG TPA: DinB family protein [Candidatus Dormibacteraeota bacterium]|nr:DinB family protein [Candidatus Dormibacteraeota bacterium]
MNAPERERLVREYRDGYRVVTEALDGIADDELDRSAEDGWTPRQIVHHLADSEMESAVRIRRLLSMDQPAILGYDEKSFASLSGDRPIGPSLEAFGNARETNMQLVERMRDADWHRAGTHTERGRYTPEDWLATYASHARDHAAQIRRARGKE